MRKLASLLLLFLLLGSGSSLAKTIASKPKTPKKPPKVAPPKAIAGNGTYGLGATPGGKKANRESTKWDTTRAKVRSRTCSFAGDSSRMIIDGRTDPVFVVAEKSCSDGTTIQGQFCVQNCPGAANRTQVIPLPSAPEVLDQLVTPVPIPRFSPQLDHVRTSNLGGYLVGMRTYFAVEPASWRPVDAPPVIRGEYSMELTAYPIGLEITVDDDVMNCDGPGVVVTGATERTADQSCSVVFSENGTSNVEVRIRYRHEYTARGFGSLVPVPPLPINEQSFSPVLALDVPVVEVQPVIINAAA